MSKQIKNILKIQIAAGKATPAPPVGPSLAPHGINIGEFCQRFNDLTKEKDGFTIPVKVTIFEDRTYELEIKNPPASELLKKAAGVDKGAGKPNKDQVGRITRNQLKEVTEKKIADLNTDNIEMAMKIIEGTAKNMGIKIEDSEK
jgi:large subunit ribosomal protein L11